MKLRIWQNIALSSVIALSFSSTAWAHSEVFSDASYDQAKQQAQSDKKLFLVDFTASWCPPCRMMESQVWTNSDVQNWIKANAIAVQIDVDKNKRVTEALDVEAMPTLVLFTPESGAKEYGRQVGFTSAAELLRWLEAAKSGKSASEAEKQQAWTDDSAIWQRVSQAGQNSAAGKNAEALEDYVWLWNNLSKTDSNQANIRLTLVPMELKKLCAGFPAAKTKCMELRDAAEKADREEWILMNGVLNDNARTLAWFDKIKTDPKQRDVVEKNITHLEAALYSASRWADAATYLYPDPIGKINLYYKRAQEMKKPPDEHTEVSKTYDPFPNMVFLLYGSYVGAGREQEAKKIADECLRLDDTAEMRTGLENMAKGMRVARDAQAKSQSKGSSKAAAAK